ncbi:MAG TPA: DUF4412 domain-containing protein [Thermoanaerobaculia bacterium]|nr:DUF4412 domain-containing protein [Thermoanaerobaculia bacterium]
MGFGVTALVALLLVTLLSTGCNGDSGVEVEGARVPSIGARVLTIRTIIPDSPVLLTTVVIADGKVRLGTETDRWRLFDVENGTVTFVDDIERTYRTETHADLMRERLATPREAVPEGLATATITKTGKSREFEGIAGDQYMITMGGYKRELWLSTTPAIVPPQLLSMMVASDPVSEDSAPAMRQVESQLAKLQGFPIFERSELQYGDKPLVMEKTLVKIEERPVARSLITIPNDYRDATVTGSAAGQQPAS